MSLQSSIGAGCEPVLFGAGLNFDDQELRTLIKQHLRIKHFLGNSENAVKTQVGCARATHVLITIVKKELKLEASLYTCLQILSVSVFEKTEISCALQTDQSQVEPANNTHQLILFDF